MLQRYSIWYHIYFCDFRPTLQSFPSRAWGRSQSRERR